VASETSLSAGLAGRYATALYELAHDAGQLDAVAGDLGRLKALIAESADLRRVIGSPLVARAQQAKAMAALVEKAGLGDPVRRFVGVIARNRRLAALPAVIDAFTALLALRRGETVAEIVSARPLTPAQADAIGAAVRGAAGRKVTLDLKVDPKLIGGLKVKVGSRLVDASLATKLSRLQFAMKGLR